MRKRRVRMRIGRSSRLRVGMDFSYGRPRILIGKGELCNGILYAGALSILSILILQTFARCPVAFSRLAVHGVEKV